MVMAANKKGRKQQENFIVFVLLIKSQENLKNFLCLCWCEINGTSVLI